MACSDDLLDVVRDILAPMVVVVAIMALAYTRLRRLDPATVSCLASVLFLVAVIVAVIAYQVHNYDPDAPKTVCPCGKYGQAVVAINGRCDCGWPKRN